MITDRNTRPGADPCALPEPSKATLERIGSLAAEILSHDAILDAEGPDAAGDKRSIAASRTAAWRALEAEVAALEPPYNPQCAAEGGPEEHAP